MSYAIRLFYGQREGMASAVECQAIDNLNLEKNVFSLLGRFDTKTSLSNLNTTFSYLFSRFRLI